MDRKILLFLVLGSSLLTGGQSEIVSASARLRELVKLDEAFTQELILFVTAVESMQDVVNVLEEDATPGFQVNSEFLLGSSINHPTDQFLVLKRFMDKWAKVKTQMSGIEDQLKHINEMGSTLRFKIEKEEAQVLTAYQGIFRLQNIYSIPAQNISQGIIFSQKSGMEFNEKDSFYCGKTAYILEEYQLCSDWMAQTEFQFFTNPFTSADWSCYRDEDLNEKPCNHDGETRDKLAELYDYYHFCEYMQGNIKESLRLATLSDQWKSNKRIQQNIQIFKDHLEKLPQNIEPELNVSEKFQLENAEISEWEKYRNICRSSLFSSTEIFTEQPYFNIWKKCYYSDNNKPELYLQPIQVEVLSESPLLFKWHGFVTNQEIETLKEDVFPVLNRATAITDGVASAASYRVSQSGWLNDEYPIAARVSRRIAQITNLTMETAEDLQIANYGIGGQYEAHYDCALPDEILPSGWSIYEHGNRLATVLIYLSDVDFGGATAFLAGNFSVQPKKGSAIFWYNLDSSGIGDLKTKHAACPVLVGIKWVANKWIHYGGQEFSLPCT